MKFYCLTSVELEANNIIENEKIDEFKKYCLTLIEIGPNENHLNIFNFQRENAEKISLLMKPESIIIKSINWKESDIIDLEFSNDANLSNINIYLIKSMRISNIKVTKNASVSADERQKYYNLISKLNNVFNNDKAAKQFIKKTKFYKAKKSSENRLRDFQKLIQTFCDSNSQNAEIPQTAKYLSTTLIKSEEDVCIEKSNYHQRKRDQKNCWSKLTFNSVTMQRFDNVWFDAKNLKELNLINIKLIDTSQEAWEIFASGIEKLLFLKKLEIHGNFEELPEIVFKKLPISLIVLKLNGLKNIFKDIQKLTNLKELSLIGNFQLIKIPWNYLPENLIKLELIETGIFEIPPDISRLVKLESFTFTKKFTIPDSWVLPNFDYIDKNAKCARISWASISKNIKFIDISQVENFEEIKYSNFTILEELTIADCPSESKDLEISKLSKTLKTILIKKLRLNFGIEDLKKCVSDFLYLNELDLSGNCLEEFPFECITKPISKIKLSNNSLKIFKFHKNVTNVKFLDLSWNEMSVVEIEEWDSAETEMNEGIILNLSHNQIQFLPFGFEKLPIKELNVCSNSFSLRFSNELDNILWKRLPESLEKLNISKNKVIRTLPCMLQNFSFLTEIIAIECSLECICPMIFGGNLFAERKCFLDIRRNDEILGTPFAPSQTFPHIQNLFKPIKCGKEFEDFEENYIMFFDIPTVTWTNYYDEKCPSKFSKILTNEKFLNTKNNKTIDLTFQSVNLYHRVPCKCCARCGIQTDAAFVEQLFTMDYELFQEEMKEEELYCNYWRANTWKTFVKTRFCAECIEKYKMEAKELHLSYKRKVDDNDDDGQENDEMNEEDVVEVQQIYNDDAETIWPVYTEPRPCSSQRKFKKAQRLNVDQNSVNNFIVNSQITSDRQLLSMEVDGSTESVSQGLNTLININENQIQNAQSINAGIQYGNSENQRHGLHIPRINASFSQTYQFPNHQPQQHTYLHTTNPQLIQQYDIHGIPVPPQIYPGTTSTTTYFSTPQNYALPQSSQCESLPQQHFSATETMPIMPSHVVSQSLLPPNPTTAAPPFSSFHYIIPKSTLLEILYTKSPLYAAGKFDSWIESNYQLEGIMDDEFSYIRSNIGYI